MAMVPMRRNPLTSMLDFAAERNREAASLGSVISQIAQPALKGMGVQTDEMTPQPAIMRGAAPAPTLVQDNAVSDDFMRRLVKQESGGNPNAVSSKGATGLTQVMPSTAVDPGYGAPSIFDLADEQGVDYGNRTESEAARLLFDPDLNLQFGTLYANAMSKRFGGDPTLTAAAYNAGPGAVEQYGGVPPYAETQGYVRNVAGSGGDDRLGGGQGTDTLGTGNNVEDILAQLYPQMSPEEERRQRRNEFFTAAGQGLSAVVQGRPVDFSNLRLERDQRRTQAVQDMRERERARAAATLVLDQGGSPAMATALATGAASMGDFMTDRQIARAEKEADRQKLLAATRMDLLAPTLVELGIPEARIAEIVAYGKEGGDVTEILTQTQAVAAAEKLREQEADQDELIAAYAASDNPVQQEIARLVTGGVPIKDAADVANKLFSQAGGQAGTAIGYADALVAAGTINQETGQPYTRAEALAATILPPQGGGGPSPMITVHPDGSTTITLPSAAPAGTTAPAGAVAPAVGAPAAGGAPTGVAGAFNQKFGGMETGIPTGAPAPAVAAGQTLPLDVALDAADLQDKMTETAQRKQELEASIANAPDEATKLAAEAELAQIKVDEAEYALQVAKEDRSLNVAEQGLAIQKAEQDVLAAQLDNEKRQNDLQKVRDDAAAEAQKAVKRDLEKERSASVVMRDGTKILAQTKDWKPGIVYGVIASAAELIPQSETNRVKTLVKGLEANLKLDSLLALKEASPTGASGMGQQSDKEAQTLAERAGSLNPAQKPEDFRDNIAGVMNQYMDFVHGTPEQIRARYEAGEISAEIAEAYSVRLVNSLESQNATITTENGPATSLGLAAVSDSVFGATGPLVVDEEIGLTPELRELFEQFKQ